MKNKASRLFVLVISLSTFSISRTEDFSFPLRTDTYAIEKKSVQKKLKERILTNEQKNFFNKLSKKANRSNELIDSLKKSSLSQSAGINKMNNSLRDYANILKTAHKRLFKTTDLEIIRGFGNKLFDLANNQYVSGTSLEVQKNSLKKLLELSFNVQLFLMLKFYEWSKKFFPESQLIVTNFLNSARKYINMGLIYLAQQYQDLSQRLQEGIPTKKKQPSFMPSSQLNLLMIARILVYPITIFSGASQSASAAELDEMIAHLQTQQAQNLFDTIKSEVLLKSLNKL